MTASCGKGLALLLAVTALCYGFYASAEYSTNKIWMLRMATIRTERALTSSGSVILSTSEDAFHTEKRSSLQQHSAEPDSVHGGTAGAGQPVSGGTSSGEAQGSVQRRRHDPSLRTGEGSNAAPAQTPERSDTGPTGAQENSTAASTGPPETSTAAPAETPKSSSTASTVASEGSTAALPTQGAGNSPALAPQALPPSPAVGEAQVAGKTSNSTPVYLAMCLLAKDAESYVREWVVYYRRLGVERIYLYDDRSKTNKMRVVLDDFVKYGLVVYRRLNKLLAKKANQMAVYRDCLRRSQGEATWLGFLDDDEYVIIMDGSPSLPAVLKQYEAYGGLVVNWRVFGSSGHKAKPPGGHLQSYTSCSFAGYSQNTRVKTFANTQYAEGDVINPHFIFYKKGYFAVNTNLTRVDGALSEPPLYDVLVINHYTIRSLKEFQAKMARGNPNLKRTMAYWNFTEAMSNETCTYAVPLGAKVQAELAAATQS